MQETPRFLLVPGLGNSGPDHWQTHFERSGPEFTRIEQREWDAPDRAEWVAAAAVQHLDIIEVPPLALYSGIALQLRAHPNGLPAERG